MTSLEVSNLQRVITKDQYALIGSYGTFEFYHLASVLGWFLIKVITAVKGSMCFYRNKT